MDSLETLGQLDRQDSPEDQDLVVHLVAQVFLERQVHLPASYIDIYLSYFDSDFVNEANDSRSIFALLSCTLEVY